MAQTITQFIMPIYTTIVGAIIGALVLRIKAMAAGRKSEKDSEAVVLQALKDGVAILLRQRLIDYYKAFRNAGCIAIDQWDEIENIHQTYKALGGNHSGDRMYYEMKQARTGLHNENLYT